MTSNDEWVRERADRLLGIYAGGVRARTVEILKREIAAFGQEAIDRGKAIAGLLNAGELAVAVDKAVSAERERIAAMLRKPDPELRHTVAMAKHSQACDGGHSIVGGPAAEAAMYALARTLTEGKENSEE